MDDKTRKLIVEVVFKPYCARCERWCEESYDWLQDRHNAGTFRLKDVTWSEYLEIWRLCPKSDKPSMPAELLQCLQSSTS